MKVSIRIVVIVAAIVVVSAVYIRSLPVEVVALGTPVRQDDFLYTVTRVVERRTHTTNSYVVTIKVDNHAKRVAYQWSDDSVYVTDSSGRRYSAASGARVRPPISAGDSAEYELTFELLAAASHPMLHYSNGILMGDVFNLGAYRRAAVPL